MSEPIDFRVLELLCGRLCHELVSPIGAVNNGVELLDEDDPDFVKEAMGLIGQSAKKAGQRLQFYRFAYGTAGTGTIASGSAPDGRELSAGLLEGGKIRCDWSPEASALPSPWQRLACNLLIVAAEALPRGGVVLVRAPSPGLEVAAEGEAVTLAPEAKAALEGMASVEELTARTVHAFYTMRLAGHVGARLSVIQEAKRVILAAARD